MRKRLISVIGFIIVSSALNVQKNTPQMVMSA